MPLSLKTRVLIGLAAVSLCIVAAPLQVPAEAPVRGDERVAQAQDPQPQAADSQDDQATAVTVSAEEPTGLEREVVPNLPFTGLDVLTLLGVAVVLTLIAWILHRLSAPR
jgi:hypothetical protein